MLAARPAVDLPRFRLRWLLGRESGLPDWFDDDEWIPPGERRLYTHAKQGLYATLDALDEDGTVLLPSYVPGGVAWAVLAAGFDVRYYPVSDDLTLPASAVAERIDVLDPEAVLFVHYFGFVDDAFDDLVATARDRGALVIEDCARGAFSRDRQGRLIGSTGDIALFSLHKTLPTPSGGLVIGRGVDVPDPGERRTEWSTIPRVAALALAHRAGVNATPRSKIDRSIDRQPCEVSPVDPRTQPGTVARRALAHCRPADVRSTRRAYYRALRALVADNSTLTVLSPPLYRGVSPFGVVAMAPTSSVRERLFERLHERGLPCEVLTWPPVYRHDEVTSFREADALRARLLVLPTHHQLDASVIGRMAACVAEA